MARPVVYFLLVAISVTRCASETAPSTDGQCHPRSYLTRDHQGHEPHDPAIRRKITSSCVNGAPLVYGTAMYDMAHPRCHNCARSIVWFGHLDFDKLGIAVTDFLTTKNLRITFSGYAAGELLITATATSNNLSQRNDKRESKRRPYYQIRVIAIPYDSSNRAFYGRLYVDAARIVRSGRKTAAETDELSSTIEQMIILSVHEGMRN